MKMIRNLHQEDYDGRIQIIYFEELNEFSGQWLKYWRVFVYAHGDHHEAWTILNGSAASKLQAATLLSIANFNANTWEEAKHAQAIAEEFQERWQPSMTREEARKLRDELVA